MFGSLCSSSKTYHDFRCELFECDFGGKTFVQLFGLLDRFDNKRFILRFLQLDVHNGLAVGCQRQNPGILLVSCTTHLIRSTISKRSQCLGNWKKDVSIKSLDNLRGLV
jgi:hypothetical protein